MRRDECIVLCIITILLICIIRKIRSKGKRLKKAIPKSTETNIQKSIPEHIIDVAFEEMPAEKGSEISNTEQNIQAWSVLCRPTSEGKYRVFERSEKTLKGTNALDKAESKENAEEINYFPVKNEEQTLKDVQFAGVRPPNDKIGIDFNNLPYVKSRKSKNSYGKRYNAYVTSRGNCYHRRRCPVLNGKKFRTIHIYTAISDKSLKPCSICKPKRKIDDWYKSQIEELKRTQITTDDILEE